MPRVVAVRTAEGLGNGYSFGNDFYQVWLSARELFQLRRDPYSVEMTRDIQVGLYGRPLDATRAGDPVDRRVFPYPAFADLLFWPAAQVPFPAIRIVVLVALFALTVATPLLWLRALDWRLATGWVGVILLLTVATYPALEGLFAEQLGLLVAFLLAAALLAIERKRFFLAGVVIALTTIKPQVTALAIFFLLLWSLSLWRERRGFVFGLIVTEGLLIGTATAVLPHWIESWIRTVLAYRHYTRPPLVTEVLTAPLGPRFATPTTLLLTSVSVLLCLLVAWRNRAANSRSFEFWFTLSLMVSVTAITILPGQAVYDHLILIPAMLLLARYYRELAAEGRVSQILLLIGALLVFWNWIAAFALILMRPLLSPAVFDSTPIFSLPIRSAASLPFAILALLVFTRRLNVGANSASA